MFEARQDESFPKREEMVLKFWEENKVFEKSLESRKGSPLFSFYDGPPFATGLPHYGHLLAGTLKDVFPRYKTMQGYYVPRRFGWDCHGLPVENEIEKEQNLKGAYDIEQFGIANFNEECSKIVLRYTKEWEKTVTRMGRWVDFKKTYKTMDLSFMESVWWVFSKLYEKGLVYEGFKVMPFSAKLGTPLSNFEANSNYKEVHDPSLTVAIQLDDTDEYLLVWTTTPWTLISNLAVAVGKDIEYVKVLDKRDNRKYILAKGRLAANFKNEEDYEIIGILKESDLEGRRYTPLFPYFKDRKQEGAFRVLVEDFVSLEDGTGIVHMAPAFGEVDFYACKNVGIDIVCPVDNNGHFTSEVPEYAKMFVKDADKQIIHFLKEQNAVFHAGQILHRYPYCWRSDTPLIYRAMTTWFVAVEKIKEELIQSNEQIEWVPDHIKHGRFGKWLENARDWAISRNRYWGTPIPLWRSEDGDILVIGSVKELEEKTGKTIDNLHRHHIDDLVIHHNGKEYKRITEVFDCWFESGSMPYAQNHYPFENKELTEEGFPADFIAEGLDQTRGWFYTLTVIATALFKKPAFKNVIVNGILLAEDGNKMSKRLKNYPDPEEVIHEYGADAIRLYLLHSPAVKAEDLRFSKKGVELTIRKSIIPFWNAFYFLSTYAKIYDWKPTSKKLMPKADIDRWILSKTQKVIEEVTCALDRYDLPLAIDPILAFIEQITNWYIRRSRSRFWSEVASDDREEAFGTLYYVIKTLSKILAPFIPFVSETIYSQLRMESDPISVHLCDYPQVDEEYLDKTLEREMDLVQRAVSIGHSLRKEQKIKVRQPLQKAHVMAANVEDLKVLEQQASLIQEELNVKEIEFKKDASAFVQLIAKPNFPVLGKRFGKMVPQIQKAVQSLSQECLENFLKTNQLNLEINGESIDLSIDEVNVERKVKEGVAAGHDEDLALAIDTQLSPELIEEGLAREIVNKLNTMRRDQGFEVTDRIHVLIDSTEKVQACYKNYKQYIDHEVLIVSLAFQVNDGSEWNLNGEKAIIQIKKA